MQTASWTTRRAAARLLPPAAAHPRPLPSMVTVWVETETEGEMEAVWHLLYPDPAAYIHELSDDLLARIFAVLDSRQLRLAAGTCRRWAELLYTRLELWHHVHLALPPKRSRGRDRCVRGGTTACLQCCPIKHGVASCSARACSPLFRPPATPPTCRRQSYTTPCAIDLGRLAHWLLMRRTAITTLEVELLYPDALALLPQVRHCSCCAMVR